MVVLPVLSLALLLLILERQYVDERDHVRTTYATVSRRMTSTAPLEYSLRLGQRFEATTAVARGLPTVPDAFAIVIA